MKRSTLTLCMALLVAPASLAQEEAANPTEAGSEGAAEPAEGDAAEPTEPDTSAEPVAPVEEKKEVEQTIYVVQGKPILVHGRFEVAPMLTQSVSDQFTSHTGLMVSGIYHIKENVAVEVVGGLFGWWDRPGQGGPRLGGRETDLTGEIKFKERLEPERVKLYQFPWLIASDLQWSPMYGKVSVQDWFLAHFNLYLSVGAGFLGLQMEEANLNPAADKTFVELNPTLGFLPAMALTTSFGGGLRFYVSDHIGFRLEVRDYVTSLGVVNDADSPSFVIDAVDSTFDVNNLVLAQLGVSFLF
jgi:outer membrane beta-barrel protein